MLLMNYMVKRNFVSVTPSTIRRQETLLMNSQKGLREDLSSRRFVFPNKLNHVAKKKKLNRIQLGVIITPLLQAKLPISSLAK